MKEQPVRFGAEGNLVGILVLPDGELDPARPMVLLYNVGFGHRVGPHRLNVQLSRALAERGFASLRFDVAGLGDSDPSLSGEAPVARASADLGEAMTFLARRCGVEQFALVSMCSGVDAGHLTATRDRRVVAAAFLDGYAYPTLGYRVRNKLWRLSKPGRWAERLRQALRRRPRAGSGASAAKGDFFERHYPTHEAFRRDVLAMREAGAQLLFVYSYRWWSFNHAGQLAAMLGLRRLPPGIRCEYWQDADHMFTSVAVRGRLVRCFAGWMEETFPAGAQEARPRMAAPLG